MQERNPVARERTRLGAGLVYAVEDPRTYIDEHILFRGVPEHVSNIPQTESGHDQTTINISLAKVGE